MRMPSFVGSIHSEMLPRKSWGSEACPALQQGRHGPFWVVWPTRPTSPARWCFCFLQVHSFQGYWEKLNFHLEYVKYSKPPLHYNNSVVRREWHGLISEEVCVGSWEQHKKQKQWCIRPRWYLWDVRLAYICSTLPIARHYSSLSRQTEGLLCCFFGVMDQFCILIVVVHESMHVIKRHRTTHSLY